MQARQRNGSQSGLTRAFDYQYGVRDVTGSRARFSIDVSGAEERFGVTANDTPGNLEARSYTPHTDQFAPGWTVQTPYGRPPDWQPDYLVCVLCGRREDITDVHECHLAQVVSHS